jgi:hypothetical protein
MSAEVPPPYWVLISVLFSSFPMEQGLALALHRVALDLYQRGQTTGAVDHQLAHGTITNMNHDAAIGSITGPTFEAELETERGQGQVRFILTRQGLDLLAHQESSAKPKYLN